MKNWFELVADSTPVRAVFGNDVPALQKIDLHEIIFHRDGPKAVLRFDLKDFPQHPPKKWLAAGFNCVQLKIMALEIQDLVLTGFHSQCVVDISIAEDSGLLRIGYKNSEVEMNVKAKALIIDGLSAYTNKNKF